MDYILYTESAQIRIWSRIGDTLLEKFVTQSEIGNTLSEKFVNQSQHSAKALDKIDTVEGVQLT